MGYILPIQSAENQRNHKQLSKRVQGPQPISPLNHLLLNQESIDYHVPHQKERAFTTTNQNSVDKISVELTGKGRYINELI